MYRLFIKRTLDVCISLLFFPLWLFLSIIVGPIIYIQDKGSIFYNSPRLGKDGKTFKMYKFRSMKINAPDLRNEDGSTFNSENDPRLTKFGKFIRKTSIDETPQIINIIKGDMSFIGPRPDLPEHINIYEKKDMEKLQVKPGVTGYNQAYFRNTIPWRKRIENDIYYNNNISFCFDIKILFKTIYTVVKRDNIFVFQDKNDD